MKRRAGESFTIGDDIEIEVLEVGGSRVKLGIVAPDSVPIVRKEARVTREENIGPRSRWPRTRSPLLPIAYGTRPRSPPDAPCPAPFTPALRCQNSDACAPVLSKNTRNLRCLPDMNQ